MRRGFVFTLDALLSLLLVMTVVAGITLITGTQSNVYSTMIYLQNKEIAQSTLEALRTVPLTNLVSPEKIDEWISDGTLNLTYVDPQMPPLDIVATYWSLNIDGYKSKASEILGYILQNMLKGYNYQLIINNYTNPYLTFGNPYQNASNVGSATTIVSGYFFNRTPRGYVAKAYLTKLVTSQERLIGIQGVLAGGEIRDIAEKYCSLSLDSFQFYYSTSWGNATNVQQGSFSIIARCVYPNYSFDFTEDLSNFPVIYLFSGNYISNLSSIIVYSNDNAIVLYISFNHGKQQGDKIVAYYSIENISYIFPDGTYLYLKPINEEVEVIWQKTENGYYSIYQSKTAGNIYLRDIDPARYYETSRYNSLKVNFEIFLPPDSNVENGLWHAAKRENHLAVVYINGNELLNFYHSDITNYITPNNNMITALFSNFGISDEIGFGSGSWISLKYTTSMPQVDNPGLVKLYSITSEGTGIYYLNSLFVPGNVTGISIQLKIEGVHEVRVYYSNGTGLNLIYENTSLDGSLTTLTIDNSTIVGNLTKYVSLQELSRRNFNLIIMLDAYYNSSYSRPVRYAGQDYNYQWNNERTLYGYPDSYINITYIPKVKTTKFMIPVEQTYSLNGENPIYWESLGRQYLAGYQTMYFDYYLPDKAIPWYVDVWTAIHFLGYPNGITTLYEGPSANTKVFEFPLDYYLIRLAYTRLNSNIMVPGETNEFRLESNSTDYVFRVDDSRAIVNYFLNGYVSYGDIFPYYAQNNACGYNLTYWYNLTGEIGKGSVVIGLCSPVETPISIDVYHLKPAEYALDDAIVRLFSQLGADMNSTYLPGTQENPIRIKLDTLSAEAIGVKSVPAVVGSIQVTLRVWRENE